MSSISSILETARQALNAQQTALNITGNNIANANTKGYSRQTPVFSNKASMSADSLFSGSGVSISSVVRSRNEFIDSQVNTQNNILSYWGEMENRSELLMNIIGEPSEVGISSLMNDFFDSWQELSNNPESASSRDNVIHQGYVLSQKFNSTSNRLTEMKSDIRTEFIDDIDQFNHMAKQVAEINTKLFQGKDSGSGHATLLDQRDQLLSEMYKLADIKVSENDLGQVSLSMNGKNFLANNFVLEIDSSATQLDLQSLTWSDGYTTTLSESGKLGALAEMYNVHVQGAIDDLDELAQGFVEGINDLHRSGYALDGTTGNNFFDGTRLTAATIQVDPVLAGDFQKIAASTDGNLANAENAINIAQFQDESYLSNGTQSYNQFFSAMVSNAGNLLNDAYSLHQGQATFVAQLESYQLESSGVSLDEEMVNMIKFERAYQAAARVITTADELAQTVINMV